MKGNITKILGFAIGAASIGYLTYTKYKERTEKHKEITEILNDEEVKEEATDNDTETKENKVKRVIEKVSDVVSSVGYGIMMTHAYWLVGAFSINFLDVLYTPLRVKKGVIITILNHVLNLIYIGGAYVIADDIFKKVYNKYVNKTEEKDYETI